MITFIRGLRRMKTINFEMTISQAKCLIKSVDEKIDDLHIHRIINKEPDEDMLLQEIQLRFIVKRLKEVYKDVEDAELLDRNFDKPITLNREI